MIALPFLTSETNYILNCPIDDTQYMFDVRWNSRDEAWYFDMYETDDTPVVLNVKIVVGLPLGIQSQHDFFKNHLITAIDTSGQGKDPGFDDLNARVKVVVQSPDDL